GAGCHGAQSDRSRAARQRSPASGTGGKSGPGGTGADAGVAETQPVNGAHDGTGEIALRAPDAIAGRRAPPDRARTARQFGADPNRDRTRTGEPGGTGAEREDSRGSAGTCAPGGREPATGADASSGIADDFLPAASSSAR